MYSILTLVTFITLFLPQSVFAQTQSLIDKMKQNIGWLALDVSNNDDPEFFIGQILEKLFGFLAVVFFILMIWGGIMWMTAAGNDSKVDKAKKIIISSAIGIIIVLTSYLITVLIVTLIRSA